MSITQHGRFTCDLRPHAFPDWKDLTAYRVPDFVRQDEVYRFFAWQFLRRNSNYQRTYHEIRTVTDQVDILLQNRRPDVRSDCVIGNYGYCQRYGITLYPRERREPLTDNNLRKMAESFFLNGFIPSPAYNQFIMPPTIGGNVRHPAFYAWDDDTAPYCALFKQHHRLIHIDLRFPLQKQFMDAQVTLENDLEDEDRSLIISGKKNLPSNFIIEYLLKHSDPPLDWTPAITGPYYRLKLINLHFNVKIQFEYHSKILKAEQQTIPEAVKRLTQKNRRTDVLVRYLRIIDALACGVETGEIVKRLYPGTSRYRIAASANKEGKGSYSPAHAAFYADRKEAHCLCQSGWRTLLD